MPALPFYAVTIAVDGKTLPTYLRAYVSHGRVFAPALPILLRVADRAWAQGDTVIVERDGRRVRLSLGNETALEQGTYVEVAPLLRGLGETLHYDGDLRRLDVWTPPPAVQTPPAAGVTAPPAPASPVFTPEPVSTPRPVWSGPPIPRRTPLPVAPPASWRHLRRTR